MGLKHGDVISTRKRALERIPKQFAVLSQTVKLKNVYL